MTPIEKLEERLGPARLTARKSGGWKEAFCVHEDPGSSKPSLYYMQDGNKLKLKCQAGCDNLDILKALGLELKDLYVTPRTNTKSGKPKDFNFDESTFDAVYPYRDEAGSLRYEVVRGHLNDGTPKQFRQRRPDASKKNGWAWNLDGIERLVYRLPELKAALAANPDELVVVAEGEKDVDRLRSIGLTATCNSGGYGGGSGWRSDHTECMNGVRQVLVIADKDKPGKNGDEPGREHATIVRAALQKIGATVTVLELPDVGDKKVKDAHDWISAGGTKEQLLELHRTAPEWTWTPRSKAGAPGTGGGLGGGSVGGGALPSKGGVPTGSGYRSLTDLGNAERLVDVHGAELMFIPSGKDGRWCHYDDATGRWGLDCRHRVDQLRNQVAEGIENDIAKVQPATPDDEDDAIRYNKEVKRVAKWAHQSKMDGRLAAMVKLARHHEAIVRPGFDEFNRDPDLLPVKNGVIDLRTGEFRKPRKADHIVRTLAVEYDPKATCPRWETSLRQSSMFDPDMVRYIQTALGYCLDGSTKTRRAFLFYGPPSSGKGTLLETFHALMGELAAEVKDPTYEQQKVKNGASAREDLEVLRGGVRAAVTFDTNRGWCPDIGLMKLLVDGAPVGSRGLYQSQSDLRLQAKLLIGSNDLPRIPFMRADFWDRFDIIAFENALPDAERDLTLKDHLKANELPGILNWCLKGNAMWREAGGRLPACERVTNKTRPGARPIPTGETEKSLAVLFTFWWQHFQNKPVRSSQVLPLALEIKCPDFDRIKAMVKEKAEDTLKVQAGAFWRLLKGWEGCQVGDFSLRFQTKEERDREAKKDGVSMAVLEMVARQSPEAMH